MIPGRPLALYHSWDGIAHADAPGRISTITDQSGNKNDTIATTAANQGYQLVGSDGMPYLYYPAILEDGASGVAVQRYNNLPTTFNRNTTGTPGAVTLNIRNWSIFAVKSHINVQIGLGTNQFILGNDTNVGGLRTDNGGFTRYPTTTDGVRDFVWTGKQVGLGWSCFGAVFKSTGVTFYEGTPATTFTDTATVANVAPGANPYIGAKSGATNVAYKMVALFDRSDFSAAEVADIMAAMNSQCKIGPPAISFVHDGDSLTRGIYGLLGQSYPTMMPMMRGWHTMQNCGLSGSTWSAQAATASVGVDPFWRSDTQNVLLPWLGINDYNPGSANKSIATIMTDAAAYIAARRAAHSWTAIGLMTTLPGFAASENSLDALNNAWRANFKTLGADFLIDLQQYPAVNPLGRWGGNTDYVYYGPDGVHLNARGNKVVGHCVVDCTKCFLANPTYSAVPHLLVN